MLEIRDLSVRIGRHQIVSIEELNLSSGQRLGLVGESGSGKTMMAMSLIGLQPRDAEVSGSIRFCGRELIGLSGRELSIIRGGEIGVVFQDPLRALNPVMRVERQLAEAVRLHNDLSRVQIRDRVLELLEKVHLPSAAGLLRRYPHQLSGGQRQRILIAIAIACRPKLLIADEPTTALDVTVQRGILELLLELSDNEDMGLLFVSHDLGVVRTISQQIAVMYGGILMEVGPAEKVIESPHHRYTEALVATNPSQVTSADLEDMIGQPLETINGSVPPLGGFPNGCRFRDRCPHEIDRCAQVPHTTRLDSGHVFKCWNPAVTLRSTNESSVQGVEAQ